MCIRDSARTGLKPEDIGIIFISPCPSKITYVKSPLGVSRSEIDGVLAIKDIYPLLLPEMKKAEHQPKDLAISGKIGIGWGGTGGEAGGLITDNYLAADGIENVIRVLEDLEDVYKRQGVHLPQDSSTVNSRKNLAISTIQLSSSITIRPPDPIMEPISSRLS